MKLHKDFLMNKLDLPYSAVKDTITNTSRWSEHHEIIFSHDGKFYETTYSQGLTESQDESPWQDIEEVECYEVQLIEKLVKVWQRV